MVLFASTWTTQDSSVIPPIKIGSGRYDRALQKQRDRWAVHQFLRGTQCLRTSLSEMIDVVE